MSNHIHFCSVCALFTLDLYCPKCQEKTGFFKPPKFSHHDKYADLKRQAMEKQRKEKGLL